MKLKFTKMQSLGNDFVMLNGVSEDIPMTAAVAGYIADRHFGVGCDQIIIAEGFDAGHDFVMGIYNSDGSKVGQCGNGARCFAQFVRDENLTSDDVIQAKTSTTRMALRMNSDGTVTAEMSPPVFDPALIPISRRESALKYRVETDGGEIEFSALSMGNPHCVISVEDADAADVETLGKWLSSHEFFPQRANIGFSQILSANEIKLRVYERGAGETLGCGSGACAAAVAGMRDGQLESEVTVNLPGGRVQAAWEGPGRPVFLHGPVSTVFKGCIEIPRL